MSSIAGAEPFIGHDRESARPIRAEWRAGLGAFADLRDSWDELFARCPDAWPYLSFPWLEVCARWSRHGSVGILTGWDAQRLVAAVPMRIGGGLVAKIATSVGTRLPSYLGVLVDPERPEAVSVLAMHCTEHRLFDVFWLKDLSTIDQHGRAWFDALKGRGFIEFQAHRNVCPFIRLGVSYDEYAAATKSTKRRQALRSEERKVVNAGAKMERYIGSELTPAVLQRIAAMQEASWMKRRGAAVLGLPFYQDLLLSMARAGMARAWIMRLGAEDAAFVLALTAHKQLHYAWTAFKLQHARLSVGKVLTNWVIRDACECGFEIFDFGHGESEYKRFWATDSHDVVRCVVGRGILGGATATAIAATWRTAEVAWVRNSYRRIKRRLKAIRLRDAG